MTDRDRYYNRAKQEGYRTRSAYKLKQLDREADLLAPGDTVLDLGAAPGGWLQVAAEAVGPEGRVVGVDRQRIDPLEADTVETLRGDVTDEATLDRLRDLFGVDDGSEGAAGDGGEAGGVRRDDAADGGADGTGRTAAAADAAARPVDLVLSDMAPNVSGEYELDHARSVGLARAALEVARALLAPGGDLAVKVFDGPDVADLRAEMEADFEYARTVTPEASRDASSERYLVAKGRLTATVAPGDELTVEVVDAGREGDGVARIDGYTLFVPDAEVGETVPVRVTDVKPRFGFAERTD